MSILRVLSQNVREGVTKFDRTSINKEAFKIIYVAPMKALAAEITRKFAKRLAWLGIVVKELTGDMQLTKNEIEETQVCSTLFFFSVILFFNLVTLSCAYFVHQADDCDYS